MVVQHNMQAANASRVLNITAWTAGKEHREVIFWIQDQPCSR